MMDGWMGGGGGGRKLIRGYDERGISLFVCC